MNASTKHARPTAISMLRDTLPRALRSSDFVFALVCLLVALPLTAAMPFADRARIAREMIAVGLPVLMAFLAIVVASLALFATISSKVFLRTFKGYPVVTKSFYWTLVVSASSVIYGFFLFLLSYIDACVSSPIFYVLGNLGIAIFFYVASLIFGVAYDVTQQLLAIAAIANLPDASTESSSDK